MQTMEIIKTSRELTPEEKFKMTLAPGGGSFKDIEGQTIEISAWCLYKDVDANGQEKTLLSILTPESEVYAGVSPTFQKDFFKAHDAMGAWGGSFNAIKIIGGETKNGRHFVTCTLPD